MQYLTIETLNLPLMVPCWQDITTYEVERIQPTLALREIAVGVGMYTWNHPVNASSVVQGLTGCKPANVEGPSWTVTSSSSLVPDSGKPSRL